MKSESLRIEVGDRVGAVSGLLVAPTKPSALLVLAHGAGAGMTHPFMEAVANLLADRGVATLRYQFPYMEAGRKAPDPPGMLEATVRAAVGAASKIATQMAAGVGVPILAGGKSMGGRMTSQAASRARGGVRDGSGAGGTTPPAGLPGVRGLVFFGFPLHAPGKPSSDRAAHLAEVPHPMLFLQGTRDTFAEMNLLRPVVGELAGNARLHVVEGADHSFHMKKSSGRTDAEVLAELADVVTGWSAGL